MEFLTQRHNPNHKHKTQKTIFHPSYSRGYVHHPVASRSDLTPEAETANL